MANTELRGVIEQVLSLGQSGGAIFTLKLAGRGRSARVLADYDVAISTPMVGETWDVTGLREMHAVYGPQIRAAKAMACRPEGEAVVPLLAGPAFPGFDMRRSRKLWRAFRDAIYAILDSDDRKSLSAAGVRGTAATALLSAWHSYIERLELVKELYACRPPSEAVDEIMRLWTTPRERIRANPYRLVSFLPWDTVDRFAQEQYDIPPGDSRRLAGSCQSAYIHNGRVLTTSISQRELGRRIAHQLGDASLPSKAIATALERSMLRRDPSAPGNALQLEGAAILKRALLHALGAIDSHGNATASPRADIILCDGLPLPAAEEALVRLRSSSLHILSALPQPSDNSNCIHILQAIRETIPSYLATAQDIFIHRADCLALTTLNKLVQRVPNAATVHLVASGLISHLDDDSLPFRSLGLSEKLCSEGLTTFLSGPTRAETSNASARARKPTVLAPRAPDISYDFVHEVSDISERVLSHYRKCSEEGTAVIIVPTPAACVYFNDTLHSEAVADREYLGASTTVAQFGSNKMACVGEPLAWRHTDLRSSCLQGLQAKLDDILPEQHSINQDFDYVRVRLDDDGQVSLSKQQSRHLSPAYALPLRHAILGRWDTVIICFHPESPASVDWVESCARLATQSSICVSHRQSGDKTTARRASKA
jgi:hypothetical protein